MAEGGGDGIEATAADTPGQHRLPRSTSTRAEVALQAAGSRVSPEAQGTAGRQGHVGKHKHWRRGPLDHVR